MALFRAIITLMSIAVVLGDRIMILKSNSEDVKNKAREVADPTHINYSRYLSLFDISKLNNVGDNCYNSVRKYVGIAGFEDVDRAQAKGSNLVIIRSKEWQPATNNPPTCVIHIVDSEASNSSALTKVSFVRNTSTRSSNEPEVTPELLARQYAFPFPSEVDRMRVGNRHAVVELSGEHINKEDLTAFFEKFVPDTQPTDSQIAKFVGQPYFPGDGADSLAEVEYIMGTSAGVKTEFWLFDGTSFCGELLKWTDAAEDSDVTVHSLSFGWQASLSDVGCSAQDISAIEAQFAKLALKGVSLIVSSGNRGSGSEVLGCAAATQHSYTGDTVIPTSSVASTSDCCILCGGTSDCFYWAANITKNHISCSLYPETAQPQAYTPVPSWRPLGGAKPSTQLWPSWPASSEFVTSVGGTSLVPQGEHFIEHCSTEFGSGGGFYKDTSIPSWQQHVIDEYFKREVNLPPKSSYTSGRGTPDVSLAGQNYLMISEGIVLSMSGTQLSTPVFAAMVSLLNEARQQRGRPVMGNIAPWLYLNASLAFSDIVVGNNKIDGSGVPLPFGWEASIGWDPVSGLGSPNFQELLTIALR
eukprot:TRINITY_DN817_c16_g1_i1.p1 TRINITY_DN817_c16_g1~~TRINITY_DN817_c16_g1_i1.p1  ORF type:complete len:584 (+),score=90.37 TRINITY_DN817_c16_g1_i1:75-1826(+)